MKRFYFAVTNYCNRSCELCSCHSNPKQKVFLTFDKFVGTLPVNEEYEVQLEGGEPFLHPDFKKMLHYCSEDGNCVKITVGTNGSLLNYAYNNGKLEFDESVRNIFNYFLEFSKPITLKPSINYHLIEHDVLHLEKCEAVKRAFDGLKALNSKYEITFNVRKRKNPDDSWIDEELHKRDLYDCSNIFFYQRYGYAKDNDELEEPFVIENPVDFHLISPDGKDFNQDLLARSVWMEGMEVV
jgi:Predicted Fe-S oxidoreductases